MGFKTERPAIFRRTSKAEENYLVLMHYMAGVLWARDAGVEAMNALTKVLASAMRRASVAGLPNHVRLLQGHRTVTSEVKRLSIELFFSSKTSVKVGGGSDLYDDITRVVSFFEARGQYPLRLDADDWLTLQGIAQRLGTSREVVRLWSAGACGPKGFPPPLNPNRDTSFYSWAEVSGWIRDHTRHDPGPDEEPVLVAMNLALQLRRLLPRLSQPEAILNLIQPTATVSDLAPVSAAAA